MAKEENPESPVENKDSHIKEDLKTSKDAHKADSNENLVERVVGEILSEEKENVKQEDKALDKEVYESLSSEGSSKKDSNSRETINFSTNTVDEIEESFFKKEEDSEGLVEAALFVAGRFLSMQELMLLTDLDKITISGIIRKLDKKYENSALSIVSRKNSHKMDVAQKYHFLINRLASGTSEFTKAEQETLAVIAYKQPVKQSVVIKIRGNKSYDHIKKFRGLGLVIARPVGHTLELSLSEEFYEYFNLHEKGQD